MAEMQRIADGPEARLTPGCKAWIELRREGHVDHVAAVARLESLNLAQDRVHGVAAVRLALVRQIRSRGIDGFEIETLDVPLRAQLLSECLGPGSLRGKRRARRKMGDHHRARSFA